MDKRIPIAVLVILALVGLTYRLLHPPAPPTPGPSGDLSSWRSSVKVGDMSASAVNPSGTCWAGGWHKEGLAKGSQESRSALRILPFASEVAHTVQFAQPGYLGHLVSLKWIDDSTVVFLLNDGDSSNSTASFIAAVDSTTAALKSSTKLSSPVSRLLGYDPSSRQFLSVTDNADGQHLATIAFDGKVTVSRDVLPFNDEGDQDELFGISPNGKYAVASVKTQLAEGRVPVFYIIIPGKGAARPIFSALDLPSKAEAVYVSDTGEVLVICRVNEDTKMLAMATQVPGDKKPTEKVSDVSLSWPHCPKELLFVSYKFIYSFEPATGKRSNVVELKNDTPERESVVQQAQGGRAYRLGTDKFVTVSLVAGTVDIRVFSSSGKVERNILPRL